MKYCGARWVFFLIALFSSLGCGKGLMGGAGIDLNILNPSATSLVQLSALEREQNHWSNPARFFEVGDSATHSVGAFANVSTATNGEGAPTTLKYYIKQVRICEDLSTSGTAYNNPKKCFELYNNDNGGYDDYLAAQASADTDPAHYLDLMDTATKNKLNRAVTAEPGNYNWGLIDWYKPVKVKASVSVNGETLVTKDATQTSSGGGYNNVATSALNAGAATESVLVLNNGGTWFKFQNTFVIEKNPKEAFVLDLVFNPDRLIKAGNTGASNATIYDASFRGIYVPMLDMTPVVHKASQVAKKESYTLTGLAKADLRLDLYYIEGDAAKTIYGVDFKSLYVAGTNENVTHPQRVAFIKDNGNGTLDFQDYQPSAILSGFTRMNAGDAGTKSATFVCQTAFTTTSTSICGSANQAVTYSAPTVSTVQ